MTTIFALCKRSANPADAQLYGTEIRYFSEYQAAVDAVTTPRGVTLESVYDIIGLDGITEHHGFFFEATNDFGQDASYDIWIEDCETEDD